MYDDAVKCVACSVSQRAASIHESFAMYDDAVKCVMCSVSLEQCVFMSPLLCMMMQ